MKRSPSARQWPPRYGGDNTWGAQVHPEYTITPHEWQYSFTMQPLSNQDDAAEKAHKKWF